MNLFESIKSNTSEEVEAKKFYVTHRITAKYTVEVTADNIEEAVAKAEEEFSNADFGVATDIDGKAIIVEDAAGNITKLED